MSASVSGTISVATKESLNAAVVEFNKHSDHKASLTWTENVGHLVLKSPQPVRGHNQWSWRLDLDSKTYQTDGDVEDAARFPHLQPFQQAFTLFSQAATVFDFKRSYEKRGFKVGISFNQEKRVMELKAVKA